MKMFCGLFFALAVVFALGCGDADTGPGGVTVTGTIVDGGKPLKSGMERTGNTGGSVTVTVQLVGDKGPVGQCATDGSGGFEIQGVPAGTYKLAVAKLTGGGMSGATPGTPSPGSANTQPGGAPSLTGNDFYKDKFSAANSKISVTVPAGASHNIGTIDLADPKYQ